MSEFEIIRQIARQTLSCHTPTDGQDNRLWDRTCRILRNVEQISRLPEPARQATGIDRPCLITAGYFSESGSVHLPAGRNVSATSALADTNDADLFAASTRIAAKKLSPVLHDIRIEKVNKIISESANRFTTLIEAMILSDARNLEDMGAIGLIHELRRNMLQGKSVSDLLDGWKCKIEYGYWQARLKESFRFDPVRQIAEQRLAAAAAFMEQVAVENRACDLEAYLPETAQKP
jgi:hypothetical protein